MSVSISGSRGIAADDLDIRGGPNGIRFLSSDGSKVNMLLSDAGSVTHGATGTPIKAITKFTPTWSPVAVAANTTAEQALVVAGLSATDKVIEIEKPTAQAGLGIVQWRMGTANTLYVTFSNNTAASITPTASQVYTVISMTF